MIAARLSRGKALDEGDICAEIQTARNSNDSITPKILAARSRNPVGVANQARKLRRGMPPPIPNTITRPGLSWEPVISTIGKYITHVKPAIDHTDQSLDGCARNQKEIARPSNKMTT